MIHLFFRYTCITMVLAFLSSCTPRAARKPEPQAAHGPIIEVSEPELEELLLAYLTGNHGDSGIPTADSLEQRLSAYLQERGFSGATFRINHDAMSFLFPVRVLKDSSPVVVQPRRQIGPQIRGEILDLQWLPNREQLLILLADSLICWQFDDLTLRAGNTIRFPDNSVRKRRSAYPAGVLSPMQQDADEDVGFIALTSNLQYAVSGSIADSVLHRVQSSQAASDPAQIHSWHIPAGRSLLYDRQGTAGAVRAFRNLDGGKLVIRLDENGRLVLFNRQSNGIVWKSVMPQGDRVFELNSGEVAVLDSRTSHFRIWNYYSDKLVPGVVSPEFDGRVSAVAPALRQGTPGFIVGVADAQPLHREVTSRLMFQQDDRRIWPQREKLPEVLFADYDAVLTIKLTGDVASNQKYHDIPFLVDRAIYENLVETDGQQVIPFLAESVSAGADKREWYIRLKPGLSFSDGTALTARDISVGWHHAIRLCQRSNCEGAWLSRQLQGIDEYLDLKNDEIAGISVENELSLKIRLQNPITEFARYLAHPCFAVRKKQGHSRYGIGTGAFALGTSSRNLFVLQRNEFYHGGVPPVKQLRIELIDNVTDHVLGGGASAVIVRQRSDIEYLKRLGSNRISGFPNSSTYYLAMNVMSTKLQDMSFRHFIADSIVDRRELQTILSNVDCEPAFAFRPGITGTGTAAAATTEWPEQSLQVLFRQEDPVAQIIAERLVARLTQAGVAASALPLSGLDFERRRSRNLYELLVDELTAKQDDESLSIALIFTAFRTWLAKAGLAANGWGEVRIDDLAGSEVERNKISIILPLLRVRNYAVIPENYKSVQLSNTAVIDAARAWLPRQTE